MGWSEWRFFFCHSWGNEPVIFTRYCVTGEKSSIGESPTRDKNIVIYDNPYVVLYVSHSCVQIAHAWPKGRVLLYACYPFSLSLWCRFAQLHWTHTVKDSRGVPKYACWVYSVEMLLVLSVTVFIFSQYVGFHVLVWSHSNVGDQENIFLIRLVTIIKSEVSTVPIAVIFFSDRVPEMVVPSYAFGFIYILILFLLLLCSLMVCTNDRVHYGPFVEILCLCITSHQYHNYVVVSESIELLKCLSGTFCRVCV